MLAEARERWWLIGLWIGWCALHSVLAADAAEARVGKHLRSRRVSYRLAYNLLALVTLAPVYLATAAAPSPRAWDWAGAWRVPQAALILAGFALLVTGARRYDLRQFAGFARPGGGGIAGEGRLATDGVQGVVRHPWYLAGLLLVWARDLRFLDVWVSAVLSSYLILGAMLEERRLVRRFGDAYREYQRRVPMLLPLGGFLRRERRPRGGRERG